MQYKSNKGFTGMGQLGVLLVLIGVCVILATIVQILMGMQMIPKNTGFNGIEKAIMEAIKKPENINLMRWMQFFSTFFLFFVPCCERLWIKLSFQSLFLVFIAFIACVCSSLSTLRFLM